MKRISSMLAECFLIIWLSLIHFTSSVQFCPPDCTCSKDFNNILCQKPLLMQIPAYIPPRVEKLQFKNNNITEISDFAFFGLDKLSNLEIIENRLKTLSPKALSGLKNLKILDLTFNHISHLDDKLFEDLKQLKTLILDNNNLSVIPTAIIYLENLKVLQIQNNQITKINFPPRMQHLQNLIKLNFNNNPITRIDFDDFAAVQKTVITLYLSNCKLLHIERGTFKNFLKLISLKLSFNPLSIASLKNVLEDLKYSITLQSLHLDGLNVNEILQPTTFLNFRNSLLCLFLSHNGITIIKTDTFQSLIHLQVLDLSYNNLSDSYMKNYLTMTNLKDLKLSHNMLSQFPYDLPTSLKMLDLSFNLIVKLSPENFLNLPNLIQLNLGHNKISEIESSSFVRLGNLNVLILSKNQLKNTIEYDVDGQLFSSLQNLVSLDISKNKLSNIPLKMFRALKNLKSLTLKENSLSKLFFEQFENLNHLYSLDLSDNVLTCSCDVRLLQKLINNNITLVNFESYICHYPAKWKNEKIMAFLNVSNDCDKHLKDYGVIIGVVAGFSTLALMFSIIYYKRLRKNKTADHLPTQSNKFTPENYNLIKFDDDFKVK